MHAHDFWSSVHSKGDSEKSNEAPCRSESQKEAALNVAPTQTHSD